MPIYTETRKLSHDLHSLWNAKLHRYPYNPVKNAACPWWILDSPDKDHVNRHRAKVKVSLMFGQRDFFVGWGVEKGYTPDDPAVSSYDPETIMDLGWHWHTLLHAAIQEQLGGVLNEALKADRPLFLNLDFWIWQGGILFSEQMIWEVRAGGYVTYLPDGHTRTDPEVLILSAALPSAQTLKDVFKTIAMTQSLEVIYGDVYFGHLYSSSQNIMPNKVLTQTIEPWAHLIGEKLEFVLV